MSSQDQGSYSYDFCDPSHPTELLDALRNFRAEGLFTDVTLLSESGCVFLCHRMVLAARSPFFRAMFTADMREKRDECVRLPGMDSEVLGAVIDFIYTSKVTVTQGNVERLIEASSLLQLGSVKQACEAFLIRLLDVVNCLGMQAFAELHMCTQLEMEGRRTILSRFEELVDQEEFKELSSERLRDVLSLPNLMRKEQTMLDALVRWVRHDGQARLKHTQELMYCLHLKLDELSFNADHNLWDNYLFADSTTFRALFAHMLKPSLNTTHVTSKKPASSMYVIGGYHWRPLAEVHAWDLQTRDSWVQGQDMPDHTRESYSVTQLGADVYVTGGYHTDTTEALDAVWVYNGDRDTWTLGTPMLWARYYHCYIALHGCVYVMGGYRGGAPTADTEFFDPLKRKWVPLARMVQGVGNATVCALYDTIYVIGGHYGFKGACTHEKIQMYRTDLNAWSIATTCPHPEYGLSSVTLNNCLYLFGGQNATVDCYDPGKNEWRELSEMKERRMECSAVVINGCVYVTGGYSLSKGAYLDTIERYDPDTDTWEIIGNLPIPTRSHGCVCLYSV
ncbi:kelch-like protein 23 isoform X1 [Pygocentrus nattereri]|uniref:BTB domain-containing protein n=1 Tax=Pygocentrus nattereri TaxID=42514 RepID=A0A3B4DTY3_PYGNA|nr:kelch-like protein 23 isoform X1 [Pygocentrus nattereri]XP_017571030.1 kelch-like protein 23 isoform X1 [Pygocentrus nattereri]XP_017571032.1 kelch-like protein 23 isoform X1 [Pygocentrus nattereri]